MNLAFDTCAVGKVWGRTTGTTRQMGNSTPAMHTAVSGSHWEGKGREGKGREGKTMPFGVDLM